MTKQIVNISDTVKQFQEKFNSTSANLGDRSRLTTSVDSDFVGAINELDSDIGARPHTTLTTAAKNITGAVNELDVDVTALQTRVSLATAFGASFTATNIMSALNEVKAQADVLDSEDAGGKVGELSNLNTPIDSDLVGAINSVYALVDSSLDFRSHFSAGEGITLTSGTISAEDATASNKGVAKFNTGNFAVASGDVTIKAGGVNTTQLATDAVTTLKIGADQVTYAKIQDVSATDRLLGRDTAGAGIIEELTPAAVRTMINTADGANNYSHPNHSGDLTSVGDGATTISADAVTYAKMQNLGTANRVLGGASAGGAIGEVQVSADMIATDAVTKEKIANDAVSSAELESVVSLNIYNSAGTAVKTLYGAGS